MGVKRRAMRRGKKGGKGVFMFDVKEELIPPHHLALGQTMCHAPFWQTDKALYNTYMTLSL